MEEGRRPPRLARLVLRAGRALAPALHRERLHRQWNADLIHRWRRGRAGRGLRGTAEGLGLTIWALGVIPHALHLRRREVVMTGIGTDLGQAWRALRRHPGAALAATAILALGIGSTSAVASAVEAVLLRPLPFPDGETLVRVYGRNTRRGLGRTSVSYPDFVDFRESGALAAAALYASGMADLAGDGEPERIGVAEVDPDFFGVLGVAALRGRLLDSGDDAADASRVMVVSEGLWRRRWGADATVVGRTVRLDGNPYTVAGILAEKHAWPVDADAWIPMGWGGSPPASARRRDNHTYQVVGRLAAGIDAEAASDRLTQVTRRARAGLGENDDDRWRSAEAVPLHRSLYAPDITRLVLFAGLGVVGVLVLACMNVAGLLLVQARRRLRELSLRAALGADRRRLVRQVLLESGLLAAVGGVGGALVGVAVLRVSLATGPAELARLGRVGLSPWVVGVAVGVSLLAAVLAGIGPALWASRSSVSDVLREGGTRASGGRTRRRGQRVLVVGEVAVSVVLLLASGLLLRSFQEQLRADQGIRVDGVLAFSLVLPRGRYGEAAEVMEFYDRARRELGALPGVRGVSITSTTPLNGGGLELIRAFLPEGAPEPPAGPEHVAQWVEIDPAYLTTLDLSPLRGRGFTKDDGPDAEPVMMVTADLAEELAPGGDVLGMRVRSWRDENVYRRVVGVLPRVRMTDVAAGDLPVVFVPRAQSPRRTRTVLLRADGDPYRLAPAARRAVERLDPDLAVAEVATLRDIQRRALAPLRFLAGLFTAFGVSALLLAVAGIYGLVAFSVATRAREIGIRMAVGASGGRVRRMVLLEGAGVVTLGLLLGLLGGAAFVRAMGSALDGVAWTDPGTWAGVAILLGAAGLAATLVPSQRASRMDPVRTLQAE